MTPFRFAALTLSTAAAMLASAAVHAHSDEYLDTLTAPHGGQLRMAGAQHLELVLVKDSAAPKDNPVVVYVTDHAGTVIPTTGATGTVTLLAGKNKVTVALTPAGGNKLEGKGRYASSPDVKAIVSVKLAGQEAQQARFTPLAPRAAADKDEHSGHQH